MESSSESESAPHVVIFPSAGIGHLAPVVEFAKRLLPRFVFTLAIPTFAPPTAAQISLVSDLPPGVNFIFLPSIHLSDADNPMLVTVPRSLSSLRQFLIAAEDRVAALVVDLFATEAIEMAVELGLRPYIFYPSTAMALSLFLHLEKLDEMVDCGFHELTESVLIPGCVPIHGRDLVVLVQDRSSDVYKWLLSHCKRYKLAEGIIVNSFQGLESGPIQELLTPGPTRPTVYPVGPLVQTRGRHKDNDYCLKWLDEQPRGSVLLVNFGSGGTLSSGPAMRVCEVSDRTGPPKIGGLKLRPPKPIGRPCLSSQQTAELAHGLARSKHRFLWVVRSPNEEDPDGAYFGIDELVNPLDQLPEGFVDQMADMGLLVPNWAPQIEVLAHVATGGFLTHCGWNSVLESVVNGVPMITWPLYAEQKMNAVMLSDELGVGIRPEVGPDGVVRAHEVVRVVTELMDPVGEEGKRMRVRMEELKVAATAAMSPDDGSSSSKAFKEIATIWEQ